VGGLGPVFGGVSHQSPPVVTGLDVYLYVHL